MASGHHSSRNPNQSGEPPMLLRMFHPTSGQQGFSGVASPIGPPTQVDPRRAMTINSETQQAIATSGISSGIPYSGYAYPQPSSYGYSQPSSYGYPQSSPYGYVPQWSNPYFPRQ